MLFSDAAIATLINHWELLVSNPIGCPIYPETLSETLLTIFNVPPLELIVIGLLLVASFSVFATLI